MPSKEELEFAELKEQFEEELNTPEGAHENLKAITEKLREHMQQHGNLLERANMLTAKGGDRREAYDHPSVDFACTARLWSAILSRSTGIPVHVDTKMVPVMMAAMKLSRLAGKLDHDDSALDIAGYMRTLEMVWESERERERS